MKLQAKEKAVKKIQELTGISLNPKALMDVQVKRIHEYKRQLLNLLSIVHRYQHIKSLSPEERKKVCFLHVCSKFFFVAVQYCQLFAQKLSQY